MGLIVEAWVHPTADKLYCEKIDLGEGAPREIASGLREHIALEDMQRRRVVVGACAAGQRGRPQPYFAPNAPTAPPSSSLSHKPQAAPSCGLHVERCVRSALVPPPRSHPPTPPLPPLSVTGMVLCATSAAGKVEFVEPPPEAKVGERIQFAGHAGAPADPNRVAKKKLFEAVAPGLRVDASRVATWEGVPFMTSAGPCTVASPEMAGASIK